MSIKDNNYFKGFLIIKRMVKFLLKLKNKTGKAESGKGVKLVRLASEHLFLPQVLNGIRPISEKQKDGLWVTKIVRKKIKNHVLENYGPNTYVLIKPVQFHKEDSISSLFVPYEVYGGK